MNQADALHRLPRLPYAATAADLGIPSATLRRLYERGLACRCTRTGDAAVRWARTEMGDRVLREEGR